MSQEDWPWSPVLNCEWGRSDGPRERAVRFWSKIPFLKRKSVLLYCTSTYYSMTQVSVVLARMADGYAMDKKYLNYLKAIL